jgi:Pyruvate/2-oxoacid:ferredoxin oxidoreductase gamma subunit
MLGAFARATGIFDVEDLDRQLRAYFAKKLAPEMVAANVRAMRRAAQEMEEG